MIVFCTTCKSRTFHLSKTLPKNLADNEGFRDCKFLVLSYGDQLGLEDYITEYHSEDIKSGRLVFYDCPTAGKFQMAHAKNMAHRCGLLEGADVLVNLDADNYTGPGYASYVDTTLRGKDTFLWAGIVKGKGRKYRGSSGRIAVTREAFLKAGGYDERYSTWSPDDKDFNYRLCQIGYEAVSTPLENLTTVFHGDGLRFQEYPEAALTSLEDEMPRLPDIGRVVNDGKVGCGEVFRNFNPVPVFLRPIPTRIFGVGLHKTGTTSLHKALSRMGLDSAHWTTPRWARTIWEEVVQGKSPTLERSYSLSDLPISILFWDLDLLYPGSKFILTVRPEADWLRSVEDHWSALNPWRDTWDSDCFTDRVHKMVYGRRTFDRDVMLARYRQHNDVVLEHFADRPGDLLVLDAGCRANWERLSEFLDFVPPVSGEWPREFHTVREG